MCSLYKSVFKSPSLPKIDIHANMRISEFVQKGTITKSKSSVCRRLFAIAYAQGRASAMVITVETLAIHTVLNKTSAYEGLRICLYAAKETWFTTPPYNPFFKKLYKIIMAMGAAKKTVNHTPIGHAYHMPILFFASGSFFIVLYPQRYSRRLRSMKYTRGLSMRFPDRRPNNWYAV